MGIALAVVRLASTSGVPEDDSINDFVFEVAGTIDSADADAIGTALAAFYNTVHVVPNQDRAIAEFISTSVSRAANASEVLIYDITADLAGTPHGSPLFLRSFTLGPEATVPGNPIPLPNEVSVVMSYNADLTDIPEVVGNTRPRARRRGKVYLGPLNSYVIEEDGSGNAIVSPNVRDVVAAAGTILKGAVGDGWRVWSRADATVRNVVAGHVDDAFDTQRRRGRVATARTTF